MPDCFDGCPNKDCIRNGHDVIPFPDCTQQPLIDRFKWDEHIIRNYPCSKCINRISKSVCARCIHNEKIS